MALEYEKNFFLCNLQRRQISWSVYPFQAFPDQSIVWAKTRSLPLSKLLVLPTNIRLGQKGPTRTDTLAYLVPQGQTLKLIWRLKDKHSNLFTSRKRKLIYLTDKGSSLFTSRTNTLAYLHQEQTLQLIWCLKDKNLVPFVSYEKKKILYLPQIPSVKKVNLRNSTQNHRKKFVIFFVKINIYFGSFCIKVNQKKDYTLNLKILSVSKQTDLKNHQHFSFECNNHPS